MDKKNNKKCQSGKITKKAGQSNTISSYFCHEIIQQRFNDEMNELSKERNESQLNSDVNQFMATTEKDEHEKTCNEQTASGPGTLNQPIEKSRNQLIDDFEKFKEINASLVKENKKLRDDNKILKKMLNISKSVVFRKCLEDKFNQSNQEPKILFQDFENSFDLHEINTLRSVGRGKGKDSQFVSKCFAFLYKNDANIMAKKCVSSKHSKNKSEISPNKQLLIQNMLRERIKAEQDTETNQFKRNDRFRKLLSTAIYHNNRKAKNAKKSIVAHCSDSGKQDIQLINYLDTYYFF